MNSLQTFLLVLISIIVVGVLYMEITENKNMEPNYSNRYFVVRDIKGRAVIIDLKEGRWRVVILGGSTSASSSPLTLSETEWSNLANR